MLDHCLSMLLEHNETDHKVRNKPVSQSVAHCWFDLRPLSHESRRLNVFNLVVDVHCDLRREKSKNQVEHHHNNITGRCVNHIDDFFVDRGGFRNSNLTCPVL